MLSADQLSQIVKAYQAIEDIDPLHQKRRAMRVQHNGKTRIFRMGRRAGESALPVQMRDISARGCSFTAKEKFDREANFVIQLQREGRTPIALLCTVKHCRSQGGQFRIGAEFTCVLDLTRARRVAGDDAVETNRIRNSILT